MDTKRLILFVIFSFSILMLWDSWQRQHTPASPESAQHADTSVPSAAREPVAGVKTELPLESGFKLQTAQRIHVETDMFKAGIETIGGDIRKLELTQQRASDSSGIISFC